MTSWARDPDEPTPPARPEPVSFRELLEQRLGIREWLALIIGVAIIAFLFGLLMHHGCTTAGPPVDHAEPGTPRFNWCRDHEDSYLWLVRLAPVVLVAALSLLLGRRAVLTAAVALLVLFGAFVLATKPGRLRYYEPVTFDPGLSSSLSHASIASRRYRL